MAEGWYYRQACQRDGAFLGGGFLFSDELKSLLIQVITSWQVLAATGVLIVYVFLVRYVARLYRRSRPVSFSPKKEKAGREEAKGVEPSDDDDLGLEETSGEE
jgi:hypothetical protein